ncbi:MAG: translation initiation factor IF-2 [Candidatus Dormibacteraeota bacterium]|uniref:Translation initiation factor IF-2 n=1 Tax=Candidatus Amunia macphersoniae TaxID=3127014 RepID=A0A934NJV5_9BACT|nr:translation initiation factor IF-2 [Candidatus Dormibacteraeota bacterium]
MKKLQLPATVTVKELAERLSVSGPELIKYLMGNGVLANLNQSVDFDTAALAADHFGFEAESEAAAAAADGASAVGRTSNRRRNPLLDFSDADPATLVARPPVVTVLGHVDHGKTSLLDRVRETTVAAGEAGGITQKIGAYQVEREGRPITFIDTPGHEAFTAMRARGADVTDIAILVVAADDGVMPQTEEAIQHVRTAEVPIIVALNKVDKDGANPDRVLQQLADRGLVSSDYGGDITVVRTSARTGQGVDDLLDMIVLTADAEVEPKANPKGRAVGTVIESDRDPGRGPVATVLVQNGSLKVGDYIVAGHVYGRIRALLDERGGRLQQAGPSTPAVVTGLSGVAEAGDVFQVMANERSARSLAEQRGFDAKERLAQPVRRITLADLASQVAEGSVKNLNVLVKADSTGSLEALRGQIEKIEDANVKVVVVASGVGPVGEADVNLAAVTDSIVIGFNVRPDDRAKLAADAQGVDVRYYDVIYQITDDIANAIKGLYEPTVIDVLQGRAEVRQVFTVDGRNAIAGSHVLDGRIPRNSTATVLRDGRQIHRSRIAVLKRFKDDVREVARGYDCGITLDDFSDFAVGDIIEAYTVEQQNL